MTSKARDSHLRRAYGITLDDYNTFLRLQDKRCGVCRRPATVFKKNLAVDHDHKTRMVRGLLCTFCNRWVIGRHRDPQLFHNAAEYLEQTSGFYVPERKKKRKRRTKH